MKEIDIKLKEPWRRFTPSKLDKTDIWYGVRGMTDGEIGEIPTFREGAKDILILGESWGTEEEKFRLPFMGKSGQLLEILLKEANIPLHRCLFTNIVNARPYGNDMSKFFLTNKEAKGKLTPVGGLYPKEQIYNDLEKLYELINLLRPKIIIGLGNYTLWAMTESDYDISATGGKYLPTGIGKYRGSQLFADATLTPDTPFLPTYHPAATFRTYPWRGMIRHDLKRVKKNLDEFDLHRSSAKSGESVKSLWSPPATYFIVRPTFTTVIEVLTDLLSRLSKTPTKIALDIETRNNFIACLGLAWFETEAMCIPIMVANTRGDEERKAGYWNFDELWQIRQKLAQILLHPNLRLSGQNLAFDIQYIANQLFILPEVHDDTMLKHHCAFPGGGDPIKGTGPQGLVQKSLNHISSLYNSYHRYWKDEGKHWDESMDEEKLWVYNCRDCCATWEANHHLDLVIDSLGLWEQYRFQIKQLNDLAIPMMLRGVKIDTYARGLMTADLLEANAEFEEKLSSMLPASLIDPRSKTPWYRSPAQLSRIFYHELGIKPVYSPTTGRPTTGKRALPIIAKREPLVRPIVEALGTLRSLNVFYGTFLSSKLSPDGRMRSSYNIAGTDTFRWSSSTDAFGCGGNLQNIPKGDKESNAEHLRQSRGVVFPNVRKQFIPDTGKLILDADLNGADAAVVAWETGEEDLKDSLRKGTKLHSVVAKELKGTDDQPHYDMFKRRIHATNYGGGARTIHQTLSGLYGNEHTSETFEREFQEYWFDRYPGVKAWHDEVKRSVAETGGVKNRFGNRIVFQDRPDTVFNQALAWIPQSTVALVTVRGAMAIQEQFAFVEILMQVHDSVIFQIPKKQRGKISAIKEVLNSVTVPYPDPLRIPWSVNISDKSWGDCEG